MKKRIKRLISIVLIAVFVFALAACGKTIGTGNGKEVQVLSGKEEAMSISSSAQLPKESKETSTEKETDGKQNSNQQTTANSGQSQSSGNTGYGGYTGGQSSQTPQESGGQSVDPVVTPPTEAPAQPPTQAPTQPPTEAPTQPPAPQYIISVTVDGCGYGGYGVMSSCTLSFPYQPSVFDVLCNSGVGVEGSAYYVSAINGLREKAYGATSGWMYSVNGATPMLSCGDYYLSSGDSVYWYYVGD